MMSPNFVVKDCFDKTQSLPNVTTQENFVTIMDSICKLMKPPSPQPINKQIEAFARYVQLLNSRDSSDPVCMDWIKPFVDTRRVTTFLGLGMSDFVTQDSQSSADSFMKIGTFSQQVYPSNDACLQVWNELLEYACKGFSLDASLLNSPPTLFLNEYTNNNRQCYLPKDEPLVVRLRLKNPFPFPLLLHDLRLSFCDVKSSFKHQNEVTHYDDDNIKFFKLSYHNVNLTGTSNEPLCFKAIGEDQSNEWLEETIVDLQAIPNGEVVQSFRVEGIRFQLCVPFPTISSINDNKDSENNASSSTNSNFVDNEDNKMLSVSGFIPIEIRGPRLAITKEQRITKQYALDKRLCFSIQPIPSPLLAFHLSDSDKHLMHETSEGIQFEAYANQILQLVFEVKNIGQCPVEKLVICTNWPGQVSVSEPNLLATSDFEHKGRWLSSKFIPWRCPTFADQTNPLSSEFEGSALLGKFICTNISESNPLLSGHRTGLRIALRAHNVKKPTDWSQLFYLLFFYISGNNCRQFRFTIRIRTVEELFSSTLQILNPNVGLYMLKLHNKLAQTLTNVKMIRLAAFFCKSNILKERNEKEILPEELNSLVINKTKNKSWDELLMLNGCTLNSLTNKVVFGSNQILSYCFFAKPSTAHELNETEALNVWKDELWLTNQLPFLDIPAWNFPLLFTKETQLEGNPEDYFENQREQMLALKILWCSTLVQPDETSNTIFGESFLLSGAVSEDTEVSVSEDTKQF